MAQSFVREQERERGAPLLQALPRAESVVTVLEADESQDESGRRVLDMDDSDIFFRSANPILKMGMERGKTMKEQDVLEVLPDDKARATAALLSVAWNARCKNGKPCIKRSMLDCWWKLACVGATIHFFEILNGFIAPVSIRNIVRYVEKDDKNLYEGLFYAVLFFVAPFTQTLLASHFVVRTRRVGIRCYSACTCMIYDKTLRLSQAAASSYGTGALVNIAQVDTGRLEMFFFQANFLWSMPMQLVISMSLLYSYLGISAFVPLFMMVLLVPLNNKLVKKMMQLNRSVNKLRDARVKVLTEVVHALRLIKMLGWEEQIYGMVGEKRNAEVTSIGKQMLWGVVNILMWLALPTVIPFLAFCPYIMMGGSMDPGIIFASLALLDSMRTPLTLFPQSISVLAQMQVGVERIERLLLAEEVVEVSASEAAENSTKSQDHSKPMFVRESSDDCADDDVCAAAYNVDFRWSKHVADENEQANNGSILQRSRGFLRRFRQSRRRDTRDVLVDDQQAATSFVTVVPPSLRVASLEIPQGKFVLVVGAVGSGKSTLLAGLLNEVPMESGQVKLCGSVSYCHQVPWIMQGTVKENILMGEAYDEARFHTVLEKCALVTDLNELKHGAETMIGERGINLSGGQKARVSLARACYKDASVFVLDDPLSAVDTHVAKHLMGECFGSKRGFLREKTRILVTHQLQYMEKVDLMVVIQNGVIAACRPPLEFSRSELEDFGLGTNLEEERELLRRQKSGEADVLQPTTKEQKKEAEAAQAPQQEDEEEREIGALSCSVWCAYARAMGFPVAVLLLCAYFGKNLMDVGATLFLSSWTGKQHEAEDDSLKNLAVYAMLSMTSVIFLASRVLIFRYVSLKVSRSYHGAAMWAVLRAPMSFLDTTPTGRIINRFSSDLQRVDMELRNTAAGFMDMVISMMFAITVSATYVPFMVFLLPLVFVYNYLQRYFRTTARELQRLLSRSKSPIFNGLDEAIIGVSSIRAFQRQQHFINRNRDAVESNARLMMNTMCCNRWLAIRLRAVGTFPVALVTLTLVLQHFINISFVTFSGAVAGLVLRFALQLTTGMEGILQTLTQMELCLVALERVNAYANLTTEPALKENGDERLTDWPAAGTIEFEDVVMRYRQGLPPVLSGVSFRIPGGTSVGVVGRTGAGKSSLLQALFRMCPLDAGTIRIDGEDISRLGLHTLRRRLAIIPQDPVGFTGTFRFNLDPFFEHSDDSIKAELVNVQLMDFVSSQEEGLAYHLAAGGENLSVGQRQLMCAARAFLRKSSILVLDEATASVDFKTDDLIQQVLRHAVTTKKLTTLTIAHRINTIMGSDNVIVMDKGVVAEFGPTQELSADAASKFYTFAHPE